MVKPVTSSNQIHRLLTQGSKGWKLLGWSWMMIVLVSEPWYDAAIHAPFQVFPSDVMICHDFQPLIRPPLTAISAEWLVLVNFEPCCKRLFLCSICFVLAWNDWPKWLHICSIVQYWTTCNFEFVGVSKKWSQLHGVTVRIEPLSGERALSCSWFPITISRAWDLYVLQEFRGSKHQHKHEKEFWATTVLGYGM